MLNWRKVNMLNVFNMLMRIFKGGMGLAQDNVNNKNLNRR